MTELPNKITNYNNSKSTNTVNINNEKKRNKENKMNSIIPSNQNPKQYPVYRNDIKFKKQRNIDPSLAIWTNDVRNDYLNKDTDSIDYRIEECKRENYEMIDLSHMDDDCFKLLFEHESFPTIKNTLQHVFATNCKLQTLPNLNQLSSLLTLDVSCNELTFLPNLPNSLEELIVDENKLTEINIDLPNLLRFNGDNNNISKIVYAKSLERIHLSNNPVSKIIGFDKLYFLDVSSTNITILYACPNLKYLDVSKTKITELPPMNSLQTLVCIDSDLSDINKLKNLHNLDMAGSKIANLPYFNGLRKLTYIDGTYLIISQRYHINYLKKNKFNIIEMTFQE